MTRNPDARGPSRRDFIALGAGAFVVSTFGLRIAHRRIVRRTIPVMGTTAELIVVTRDERNGHAAMTAAANALHEVERTMSRFRRDSDIGRANAARAGMPVAVTPGTAAVVTAALHWANAGGSFDPALGRVTELWDVPHRRVPPAPEDVRRHAGRRLYRHIELDTYGGDNVLVLHEQDVALDLGGIAKGYGVDRAVAALREWGITDGLVNVGGDLYALGTSLDDDGWNVGIRSPYDPARLAGSLVLRDRAVATSGDYEQYFDHGGRRYHHLLDPATAAPRASASHSVTIAAATCMTADAAATAIFGSPGDHAARVVRSAAADAEIILFS